MRLRTADSFTILQAHRVKAAGLTLIEDGDGETGVFCTETAKRIGTMTADGMKPEPAPKLSPADAFWFGALAGFALSSAIAILVCRYAITLPH